MELRDYLEIFARRKWVFFATVFMTLLIAVANVAFVAPTYTATAQIRILTARGGSVEFLSYEIQYTDRIMDTYKVIATSEPVINEIEQKLSVAIDPNQIDVERIQNTELIEINYTDKNPDFAMQVADTLAEILVAWTQEGRFGDKNALTVSLIDPARIAHPQPILTILIGLAVGILGGFGLVFLFENLDTRLYSSKEIEDITGLKIIGDIPDGGQKETLLIKESRVHAEAFRRLRTNILSMKKDKRITPLLVTSSVAQDGRSTITVNLAASIAQANLHVVALDADFRRPSLDRILNVESMHGLSDVLQQQVNLSEAIQKTPINNVDLITSGKSPTESVELLRSEYMDEVLDQLAQSYDIIIIDSPASVTVTDPAVLATKVEAVILVVRHGWVRREALQATTRHLGSVNANIIGVVENRTELGTGSKFAKIPPVSNDVA